MQPDIPYRQSHQQAPDEWKLEQGLEPARLGIRNQSSIQINTEPHRLNPNDHEELKGSDIPEDPDLDVQDERPGWKGYVEWEDYPEKKAKAHQRFSRFTFPPPPEFQLEPLPSTNPVLEGKRWKLWHKAIGGILDQVPRISWETVLKEKHPEMLHLLEFPYNGEAPKSLLTRDYIMPNELHFVRNHGGIPDIEASAYDIRLDGLVNDPKTLTLADLQDESLFPRISKLVTIQCSGTRRFEQIVEYPGEGDEMINAPWAEGAIGTAKWTGVSLKKVIKYCGGLKDGAKHLELYGADTYFKGGQCMNYVVSVPWSKVKANEVMLAWEMNDKPLPKIHGFPLRAVVFGYIGARSCKWLYRIKAIEKPSLAPVQSREYLYFQQQTGKHNQLPTMGIQIQEMPVSSAIMSPWNKEVVVHDGEIEVKGWAYSGGGRWPERVEISSDGGYVWYAVPIENLSPKHKFAWRTFTGKVPCDHEGWTELVVRCWDNSLNTQPKESNETPVYTLAEGKPVEDPTPSVVLRGPKVRGGGLALLADTQLIETLAHFPRERIPERVVHAKAAGAWGYFERTHDITDWCSAAPFRRIGKQTQVLARLSTVAGEKGSSDTLRDIRGFALKMKTEEGNWDFVGNDLPVFFIRDPAKFPSLNRSHKRHPQTAVADASMFWDFHNNNQEGAHCLMQLFGPCGVPQSLKNVSGFGNHTFKFGKPEDGSFKYVKIHFKPDDGIKNISQENAIRLAGEEPDYHVKDMYNSIERGDYPTWTMYLQDYPLIPVGKLVLNKNPDNHFHAIEQAAFSPSTLIPGIAPSADIMLHARMFSYPDAARYRVGPNYQQLPCNRPLDAYSPYQRDGAMRLDGNYSSDPDYVRSSFRKVKSGPADVAHSEWPRNLWKIFKDNEEDEVFLNNLSGHVNKALPEVQEATVRMWANVDEEISKRLGEKLKNLTGDFDHSQAPPSQTVLASRRK
ncbi:probable catalase isozyme P [Fusarium fujikuroi IMI 58289]|uniref:Probable catalase isozyme P n=1 Tax=Gibberella fujikuroi (strain CBS 195.34 / IMI 58289 / NRRL A-6831) TaxID=1279085 RepID=S0EKT8_GIBF5|nr:probable catalase isozyme P [Fusarium fujikuroi IMI 58289]CCT75451.1 probable catalase isozyme P [Fusarium fujikuroi IMI 58289]